MVLAATVMAAARWQPGGSMVPILWVRAGNDSWNCGGACGMWHDGKRGVNSGGECGSWTCG